VRFATDRADGFLRPDNLVVRTPRRGDEALRGGCRSITQLRQTAGNGLRVRPARCVLVQHSGDQLLKTGGHCRAVCRLERWRFSVENVARRIL
jgi:hypothetical protein